MQYISYCIQNTDSIISKIGLLKLALLQNKSDRLFSFLASGADFHCYRSETQKMYNIQRYFVFQINTLSFFCPSLIFIGIWTNHEMDKNVVAKFTFSESKNEIFVNVM